MPIAICRACKSHAGKVIDYVLDVTKAERVYTHGLDESKDLSQQFSDTARMFGKGDAYEERKYYHIKFSFAPEDSVVHGGKLDAEIAEVIANIYLQSHYSEHEYILAVHTDKEHIHTHAIVNAVSFVDGKKIQHSNRDLAKMKDEINDISARYGVSGFDWKKAVKNKRLVIKQERIREPQNISQSETYLQDRHGEDWTAYSWKDTLRKKIDEAKNICASRVELQAYLQDNYDIEMPRNTQKTVSFKHPALDATVRGGKLGADYTSQALELSFEQNRKRGISYAKVRIAEQNREIISTNETPRTKPSEQNGVREQSAQGEFDGVYGTIRAIEARAKQLSGTGREEIREREDAKQAELARVGEEQRQQAERDEQEREQSEREQQATLRRHRSHDYEYEM